MNGSINGRLTTNGASLRLNSNATGIVNLICPVTNNQREALFSSEDSRYWGHIVLRAIFDGEELTDAVTAQLWYDGHDLSLIHI